MKTLFLGCSLFLLTAFGFSQAEIRPYMPSSELHGLVGKKAKVEGVYYGDIFEAPVILIKGHTFYLLQNPPSKRTFRFPTKSRPATVTGILYFYDHAQLNNAEYGAIGKEYFFFNIDDSEVDFGEASVVDGQRAFMKTWKFNLSYTKEQVGDDAREVMSEREFDEISDDDFGRMMVDSFSLGFYEALRNSRLIVAEDSLTLMLSDKDSPPSGFELVSIEGSLMKGIVDEAGDKTEVELEILSNGKLRYSLVIDDESEVGMHFYFDP